MKPINKASVLDNFNYKNSFVELRCPTYCCFFYAYFKITLSTYKPALLSLVFYEKND